MNKLVGCKIWFMTAKNFYDFKLRLIVLYIGPSIKVVKVGVIIIP